MCRRLGCQATVVINSVRSTAVEGKAWRTELWQQIRGVRGIGSIVRVADIGHHNGAVNDAATAAIKGDASASNHQDGAGPTEIAAGDHVPRHQKNAGAATDAGVTGDRDHLGIGNTPPIRDRTTVCYHLVG